MTHRLPALTIALAALCGAGIARAQAPLAIAQMAASCAGCHGTEGRAVPGSGLAPLAGTPKSQTLQTLLAFKAGTRPSTVMQQLAKGYTDAQLEAIAGYFAGRQP